MHWLKGVLLVALTTAAVLFWTAFAPTILGGKATYAIVEGSSMAPLLQRGDLVVLHKAPEVQVGDVVGYRSGTGALVVHRVIKVQDDRLVFKGDANWWVDSDTRSPQEAIGTLWLRVGAMGDLYAWLREPWRAGLLAGGLVALAVLLQQEPMRRGPGGTGTLHSARSRLPALRPGMVWARGYGATLMGMTAALFLLSLTVFSVGQMQPTMVTTQTVDFYHEGAFSYSAPQPPLPEGAIYDGDIETGDPIFVNMTPGINVVFRYSLDTEGELENVTGVITSYFVLRDVTGWSYEGTSGPNTTFQGPDVVTSKPVDLRPLMQAAAAFQKVRQGYSSEFTAAAVVNVHVTGTLDGKPFEDTFSPLYAYRIRPPYEMYMQTPSPGLLDGVGENPSKPAKDPFLVQTKNVVYIPVSVENKLAIGPLLIHVDEARVVALGLIALTLLGFAGLWYAYRDYQRLGPLYRIHMKCGHDLARASYPQNTEGIPVVHMETIEELINMARVEGKLVLWDERPWSSVFFLFDNGPTIYVYELVALGNTDDEKLDSWAEEIGNAP